MALWDHADAIPVGYNPQYTSNGKELTIKWIELFTEIPALDKCFNKKHNILRWAVYEIGSVYRSSMPIVHLTKCDFCECPATFNIEETVSVCDDCLIDFKMVKYDKSRGNRVVTFADEGIYMDPVIDMIQSHEFLHVVYIRSVIVIDQLTIPMLYGDKISVASPGMYSVCQYRKQCREAFIDAYWPKYASIPMIMIPDLRRLTAMMFIEALW